MNSLSKLNKGDKKMKKYKSYIIGMLLLLPISLLIHTFAYTTEDIRIFYCILEYLGMYNSYMYSTRNLILWIIIILLLVVLLTIAIKLINSDKYNLRHYHFLRVLPYMIICLNLVSCFIFAKIDRLFLQYRHGMDGIIVPNRGTTHLLGSTGTDELGNRIGLFFHLSLESFGSEGEDFYIKLINIEDETKQYIHSDENGIPQKYNMGEIVNIWNLDKGNYKARRQFILIDMEKIIPGYVDMIENRHLIKYKVVLFNDNESKEFLFYFRE